MTEIETTKKTDWVADIAEMHTKFGVNPVIRNLDNQKLLKFLEFRLKFLQEELDEAKEAFRLLVDSEGIISGNLGEKVDHARSVALKSAEDIVDALIDLSVVSIGTLDAFEVNSYEAWNRVHDKNMQKEPGIKPERPNPLGLPDLIKPAGWTAPTHADNVGLLTKVFN